MNLNKRLYVIRVEDLNDNEERVLCITRKIHKLIYRFNELTNHITAHRSLVAYQVKDGCQFSLDNQLPIFWENYYERYYSVTYWKNKVEKDEDSWWRRIFHPSLRRGSEKQKQGVVVHKM